MKFQHCTASNAMVCKNTETSSHAIMFFKIVSTDLSRNRVPDSLMTPITKPK